MAVILNYEEGTKTINGSIIEQNQIAWQMTKDKLKELGFRFNWESKAWEMDLRAYKFKRDKIKQAFNDRLRENPGVEEACAAAISVKSELKQYRGDNITWTNLSCMPFKGKHPYEDFQKDDILRAIKQNRFLFNWETGCGKTYALAAIYEYLKNDLKALNKAFIITSKIGVFNIRKELAIDNEPRPGFCKDITFDQILACPASGHLDRAIMDYKKAHKKDPGFVMPEKRHVFDIPGKEIYIFSYDSFSALHKAYGGKVGFRKALKEHFGDTKVLFLDEVHYARNPKAGRYKALHDILDEFEYRYLFTATLASREEHLYAPSNIMDPWLVDGLTFNQWCQIHNDIGTHWSQYAINRNGWHKKEIDELNENLINYSTKRKAEDVLEIPPLYDHPEYWIDMSDAHRALYEKVAESIIKVAVRKHKMEKGDHTFDDAIISQFTIMQTIVENPLVFADKVGDPSKIFQEPETSWIPDACAQFDYLRDSSKLEILEDILEDKMENEKRGIVWYNHPKTFEFLKQNLEKYNPICITADDSDEERISKAEYFKKHDEHKIILASVNVLTSSVTLSPEATFLIYYENTYNYDNFIQSKGRIHRIGQKELAEAYYLYYKDSTDVFMQMAIQRKESISAKTLKNAGFTGPNVLMDKKVLKALFKPSVSG